MIQNALFRQCLATVPEEHCPKTPQEGVGNIKMVDWQTQLHHAVFP